MPNTSSGDISKAKISSRYRFQAEKELRGLSGIADAKLKGIKMNGESMNREKLLDLVASIGKRNKRDVTVKDLETHLYNKSRYGIKIDFKEKQKLLAWVKERARKNMPKAPSPAATKQASFKDQGYERKLASIPGRYLGQSGARAASLGDKALPQSSQFARNTTGPSMRQSLIQGGAKSGFSSLYSVGIHGVPGGQIGRVGGRLL